jgi:hypothetical protein
MLNMKTKTLRTFALNGILIFTCLVAGFTGFNKCDAQSIVGKWNQISSKQFLTAEGSKTHGKSVLETQMSSIGTVVFDFKSDHTYVEKTSHAGDSRVLTLIGTWSLSGNQLELKLGSNQEDPKYNPKNDVVTPKISLSINGTTMVWSTLYPDSKITTKIELTFKRL